MDPQAALYAILDGLYNMGCDASQPNETLRTEVIESMDALKGWLTSGGFLPTIIKHRCGYEVTR